MHDDEEAGRETPEGTPVRPAGAGKEPAPKKGAGDKTPKEKDKGKERVDRVRYEPDSDPPLSGGTSQILTR